MNSDSSILKYQHYFVDNPDNEDKVFCFNEQALYLDNGKVPTYRNMAEIAKNTEATFYCFAELKEQRCLLVDDKEIFQSSSLVPYNFKETWKSLAEELQPLGALACHLSHWRLTHQYCGACAFRLTEKSDERARICQNCGYITYPKISPSIIALVKKDNKFLLARSPHFKKGIYSALAGFVEPGETIESAVHREVYEEVGVKIDNLTYIGSQPWPFPDSLMIAFTADHKSGEINIDNVEIEDANWFDTHHLPELPSEISIARQLIDNYLRT